LRRYQGLAGQTLPAAMAPQTVPAAMTVPGMAIRGIPIRAMAMVRVIAGLMDAVGRCARRHA
jgi:hypothetical protein